MQFLRINGATLYVDIVDGPVLCDTGSRIGSTEQYDTRIGDVCRNGKAAFADRQVRRRFGSFPLYRRSRGHGRQHSWLSRHPDR